MESEFDFVSSTLAFDKLAVKDDVPAPTAEAAPVAYDKKKSFFDNISCEASAPEVAYNRWEGCGTAVVGSEVLGGSDVDKCLFEGRG